MATLLIALTAVIAALAGAWAVAGGAPGASGARAAPQERPDRRHPPPGAEGGGASAGRFPRACLDPADRCLPGVAPAPLCIYPDRCSPGERLLVPLCPRGGERCLARERLICPHLPQGCNPGDQVVCPYPLARCLPGPRLHPCVVKGTCEPPCLPARPYWCTGPVLCPDAAGAPCPMRPLSSCPDGGCALVTEPAGICVPGAGSCADHFTCPGDRACAPPSTSRGGPANTELPATAPR